MKTIDEIIKTECLPLRDCMLTVQDVNGEAGFLYFKDGELIEANYATHWGKEAMAQILTWELSEHMVAPLPLGIKRSLWDSLESLLNPGVQVTASGRIPTVVPRFSTTKAKKDEPTPYDHFKNVQGVTKLIMIEEGRHRVVYQAENEAVEQTEWIEDFLQRAKSVGETLGFGRLDKWTLITDRYQIVGVKQETGTLGVLRKHEVGLDDFEQACESSLRNS